MISSTIHSEEVSEIPAVLSHPPVLTEGAKGGHNTSIGNWESFQKESKAPGLLAATPILQSHPIPEVNEASDAEGASTPLRKRKSEAIDEITGKRCKDSIGKRAPLRVVPDTESNRQSSIVASKLKGGKNGCSWSAIEKENKSTGKLQSVKAGADNVGGVMECNGCGEVLAAVNRSNSILLSNDTLDRTAESNITLEQKADSTIDSLQSKECGEVLENGAEHVEGGNWNQLGHCPGVWQISCDNSVLVASHGCAGGLWGGMPMHGPLLNPVPIVRNHAPGDRKILVLDMDETLIHASAQELPDFDFKVIDPFGMCDNKISVKKRPHVQFFLEKVAKLFKLVVFTAGTKEYASQVLDQLDTSGTLFAHRLFRDHCVLIGHLMVKDLRLITSNLSQVIIVDNTPSAYLLQRENGVHIPSYFGTDGNDCELLRLLPLLEKLAEADDVRPLIVRHAAASHASQFQLNPNAQEFQPVANSLAGTHNEPDVSASQFLLNPDAPEFQPEASTQQEAILAQESLINEQNAAS